MMALRRFLRLVRRTSQMASAALLDRWVEIVSRATPSLNRPPEDPKALFVLRNNDIGDLLVVTPLFEALHRRFPDAKLAVGIGDWNTEVLANNPHVSEVLSVNAPWFNKYLRKTGPVGRLRYLYSAEVQALTKRRFDIGVDVLGSAWGSLLLLRAAIPYRMGVSGYAGGERGVQTRVRFEPGEHVGRSALRFAELLGARELPACRPQIFLTAEEVEWGENWWESAEGEGKRKQRVTLAPGGGLPSKVWPLENFVALASGLGNRSELSLLVLGGPSEQRLVAAIAAIASGARTIEPAPPLRKVFALLAASDVVICNSSMAMHAAAAFSKPTIVLLGPSFPSAKAHQAQWGYPGVSRSLGREPGERLEVVDPAEALAVAGSVLGSLPPRNGLESRSRAIVLNPAVSLNRS